MHDAYWTKKSNTTWPIGLRKATQRGVKVALVGAEELVKQTNALEKK